MYIYISTYTHINTHIHKNTQTHIQKQLQRGKLNKFISYICKLMEKLSIFFFNNEMSLVHSF